MHLAGPVNKFILVRKIHITQRFEVTPYPEIIVRYYLIPMPNFMLLSQCAQYSCSAAGLKGAQMDLFILKLCTWYDLLGANNTTCKTNDLIQSRSIFLLLQNYSQAFFPIEIIVWLLQRYLLEANPLWTLTFTERRREKLYQKYLKDKISIHKNYHLSSKNTKPKNIWS